MRLVIKTEGFIVWVRCGKARGKKKIKKSDQFEACQGGEEESSWISISLACCGSLAQIQDIDFKLVLIWFKLWYFKSRHLIFEHDRRKIHGEYFVALCEKSDTQSTEDKLWRRQEGKQKKDQHFSRLYTQMKMRNSLSLYSSTGGGSSV